MTQRVAGRTEVGLVRRRNEDALYVGEHLFAVADGFGGHVGDELIHHALADNETADDAAGRLVRLALDNGAPDNVTVLVLDA